MDADQFATLTRALAAARSRRGALAALAGALGLRGRAHPAGAGAARSRKCKRKPGECERCDKGDCDKKNGEKTCTRGKIKPKANGTACSLGTCQTGTCVPPPPSPPSPPPVCTAACGDPGECSSVGCLCAYSVEGRAFCINLTPGYCVTPCTSSAECGGGFCGTAACCASPSPRCFPAANICTT
jgi:hypothetical protein